MEAYTVTGRIGEGAHGVVVKAKHNISGKSVALKKIPLRRLDQGMPATALREIKALQQVQSEHVSKNHYLISLNKCNPYWINSKYSLICVPYNAGILCYEQPMSSSNTTIKIVSSGY